MTDKIKVELPIEPWGDDGATVAGISLSGAKWRELAETGEIPDVIQVLVPGLFNGTVKVILELMCGAPAVVEWLDRPTPEEPTLRGAVVSARGKSQPVGAKRVLLYRTLTSKSHPWEQGGSYCSWNNILTYHTDIRIEFEGVKE